ncbi:asparagine synthase-related protein [Nitrosopumilus adriaticus]|uniref:asparagine synthase-related protein n=1 Tax=Nitrosopumilus adriaticus TaxID=1580092 RepID=UPI00352DABE6
MEKSKKKILDQSSIIDILTLRYDHTQPSPLEKLSWSDFVPKNKTSIKTIEKNLDENITKIVGNKQPETIAIALSGGIDSILTLVTLKKKFPESKFESISIKFANSTDETNLAGKVAKHFKINHHIIEIKNYLEELPKAISIIKLPFWDLHWYYVAKKASTLSNFIASGDGGDELFGGYTFRYKKFLSLISEKSKPDEKILAYLECHERDRVPDQEKLFGEKVNFSWSYIHSILLPYFDNPLPPLEQVFLADYNGKLLYNFAPINSRINQYFKISSITPIISKEMISYATHLSSAEKYDFKKDLGKIPLREILSNHQVDSFISPKKLGFSVNTLNLWETYGKRICKEYLLDSRAVRDGWINANWIKKNIDNEDLSIKIVNKFLGLLALEIWYRLFVTKEMKPEQKLN